MASLEGQKQYSRVDFEDPILSVFLESAKSYLKNAGIEEPQVPEGEEQKENLYDICVYMIADHWYNCRGAMTEGRYSKELPYGITAIILQLREGDSKNELGGL